VGENRGCRVIVIRRSWGLSLRYSIDGQTGGEGYRGCAFLVFVQFAFMHSDAMLLRVITQDFLGKDVVP
jgi:hypothetical protein